MILYLAGEVYGRDIFPKVDYKFNRLETFWSIYNNAQIEKDISKYDNFILDSGAFTFINAKDKGKSIKLDIDSFTDEYCDYINTFNIDNFFEMDVDSIYGYDKVKQLRRRIEKKTGKQPIPVFHKNRGKEEFIAHCKDYPYVSLGGIVTKEAKWTPEYMLAFVLKAQEYNTKIHGLGVTAMNVLKKVPFYSVDSSSWTTGNRFKGMYLFNGKELDKLNSLLKNKRISDHRELALHNLQEWIKLSNYLKDRKTL